MGKINKKINNQTERLAPPPPPLSRVTREGCLKTCTNCGSTASRRCLFGVMLCHNKECPNSKKRFI